MQCTAKPKHMHYGQKGLLVSITQGINIKFNFWQLKFGPVGMVDELKLDTVVADTDGGSMDSG